MMCSVPGAGELAIAHKSTKRDLPRHPAAADSDLTVGAMHFAHQQVQRAVAGNGRNGVLAMRQGLQRFVPRRVARVDLGDVSGLPFRRCPRSRCECEMEAWIAGAAGIQQIALDESPAFMPRRLPIGQVGARAEHTELMLPVAQCASSPLFTSTTSNSGVAP